MQAAVELNFAEKLAVFLRDYGVYATEALLIIAVVYLFRVLRRSETEKFELALSIAPLADRMTDMMERAASRARARHNQSSPPPSTTENLHG
jgi:hypothetical protein